MIPTVTNEIIESLYDCQVASPSLKSINVIQWPRGLKTLTFMSNTILIERKDLQDQLRMKDKSWSCSKQSTSDTKVVITSLDYRWFVQEKKNFFTFARYLNDLPSSFYSSEFAILLLEQLFERAQNKIIKQQLIPSVIYIAAAITYFLQSLGSRDESSYDRLADNILAACTIVLLIY